MVRVTVIVNDSHGFTHYYEELETTPSAVRDAFDLMARAAPSRTRDEHVDGAATSASETV